MSGKFLRGLCALVCAAGITLLAGPLRGQLPPQANASQATPSQATPSQPDHMVVVRFSATLFQQLQRPVDRVTQVRRNILGTDVRGVARTQGQLAIEMDADHQRGSFIFHLTGATHSQTQGHNGPAVIHSRSTTRFHAVKRIVFDLEGGFRCGPCAIHSETRSQTCDIDVARRGIVGRIVERVAWRRVAEQRAEADRIGNALAQQEIMQYFDAAVDERLVELNERDDLPALITALVGAAMRGEPEINTTHQYLQVCFRRQGTPATAITLPEDRVPKAPIEIWFHSSLIDKELPQVLRGYENLLQVITPNTETATLSRVLERAPRDEQSPRLDLTLADGWFVLGLSREQTANGRTRVVATE